MAHDPGTHSPSDRIGIQVICGSLRSGSYNAAVARNLPALAPPNMQVGFLDGLAEFPPYDADLQEKAMPLVVSDWGNSIQKADGIVIVMPEYNYSVPGVLKNALDWVSRLPSKPFEGKPVAIQTASPGMLGGVRAQYHLRQIMVYLGAHVINRPEIMIANVAEKIDTGGLVTDSPTRDLISQQLAVLDDWVRRLVPGP